MAESPGRPRQPQQQQQQQERDHESTNSAMTTDMEQSSRDFMDDADRTVLKILRTLESLPSGKLGHLSRVLELHTKRQLQKLWICLTTTLADEILRELESMNNDQRRLLLGRVALRQLSTIANAAFHDPVNENNTNLGSVRSASHSEFESRKKHFGIHDACLPDLASGFDVDSAHGTPLQSPDTPFESLGPPSSNLHSNMDLEQQPLGREDSDAAHFLLLLSENRQRLVQSGIHSMDWFAYSDWYREMLEDYSGTPSGKFSLLQTDGWREQLQETLVQNLLRVGLTFPGLAGPGSNLPSSIRHYVDTVGKFQRLVNSLSLKDGGPHPWSGSPPAATWVVSTLSYIHVDDQHLQSGLGNCSICREALELRSVARQLPCSHLYHHACIVQWLSRRNSCPVCRFELPTDDLNYELDHHHSWISDLPALPPQSIQ